MEDNNKVYYLAGKEAEDIIENSGNINLKNPIYFWNLKKKILKEKYKIDWKTPKEENPGTMYD